MEIFGVTFPVPVHIMLRTSLQSLFCGNRCQSLTKTCPNSARFWHGISWSSIILPKWSHTCSMGLGSGERAGLEKTSVPHSAKIPERPPAKRNFYNKIPQWRRTRSILSIWCSINLLLSEKWISIQYLAHAVTWPVQTGAIMSRCNPGTFTGLLDSIPAPFILRVTARTETLLGRGPNSLRRSPIELVHGDIRLCFPEWWHSLTMPVVRCP